jgi:hypothetical protein
LHSLSKRIPQNIEEQFVNKLKESFDWIGNWKVPQLQEEKKEFEAFTSEKNQIHIIFKAITKAQKAIIDIPFIFKTLYFCALITIRHSSLTRYPNFEKELNPIEIYNRKLPIIRKQPDFMELLDKAISKLLKLVDVKNLNSK